MATTEWRQVRVHYLERGILRHALYWEGPRGNGQVIHLKVFASDAVCDCPNQKQLIERLEGIRHAVHH